jgi:dihydrolipoyl dehydrogenase
MDRKNFDVAIIGSGPGGYTAAIRATQLGLKTALIEKRYLGGVCLNVGCIPTKAILTSADVLDVIKRSEEFGLSLKDISFDIEKIIERKDKIVTSLRNSLKGLLLANKIEIIEGNAKFLSKNEIEISGQTNVLIEAKNVVIATGSYPTEIESVVVDHKKVFNSNSILSLKTLPKSLTIVGGGYIGCEFASFYARLGVKVTIIEALPSILYTHGKEIANLLSSSFKKQNIDLKTNLKVKKSEITDSLVKVYLNNSEVIESEIALVAIGRRPFTKDLNLQKADVAMGKHGEIIVDKKQKTNQDNIYAIGDVIGKWMLAHTASHEALVAIDNIKGLDNNMDFSAVPAIIFAKPEIATVGLSPESAKEQNMDVDIAKFPYSALGKAHALSEKQGFVLVIVDKKSKIILGAQAIGASASVLIAEMGLAITNKLKAKNVMETMHAHPTLAESWLEAISISQNRPINFFPNMKL